MGETVQKDTLRYLGIVDMWVIVLYETISTAIRFLDCRTCKSNKSISNLRPWGHDGFFSEERESEKEASKSQRAG